MSENNPVNQRERAEEFAERNTVDSDGGMYDAHGNPIPCEAAEEIMFWRKYALNKWTNPPRSQQEALDQIRARIESSGPNTAEAVELLVSVRDFSVNENGICAICLVDPHSPGCVIELVENFIHKLDEEAELRESTSPQESKEK